jgi:hypothetical protein
MIILMVLKSRRTEKHDNCPMIGHSTTFQVMTKFIANENIESYRRLLVVSSALWTRYHAASFLARSLSSLPESRIDASLHMVFGVLWIHFQKDFLQLLNVATFKGFLHFSRQCLNDFQWIQASGT